MGVVSSVPEAFQLIYRSSEIVSVALVLHCLYRIYDSEVGVTHRVFHDVRTFLPGKPGRSPKERVATLSIVFPMNQATQAHLFGLQ